jgi:toxin CcdB
MAQFDIYENPNRTPGDPVKYLLDLQAGHLDDLPTRVVAPLVPPESLGPPMRILNPRIEVHGEPHILLSHLLAAIPAKVLGRSIDSATAQRDEIIGSVDFLLTGS